MKKIRRSFSLLLALSLLFASLAFGASALPDAQWDAYWDSVKDDNSLISLTPGSDETQMNFRWHSSHKAGYPLVNVSKSPDMANSVAHLGRKEASENAYQRVNKVTVDGLEPGTVYYYTYRLENGYSQPLAFKTPPLGKVKFMFVSDIQCSGAGGDEEARLLNARLWNRTLETALNNNADIDFIVAAGDNANKAVTEEWIASLSPPALRSMPMATVVGNHDMKSNIYSRYVNNPNIFHGTTPNHVGNGYWFTAGDVLFVMLNSNKINMADHYLLIREALKTNPNAKWRVAVMHHDIYGTRGHADIHKNTDAYLLQCGLGTLFDEYGFDMVLTGHDHVYGRSYYMKNNKNVDNPGYADGKVTDPKGTIYFTASAAAGKSRAMDEMYSYPWLAYSVFGTETGIDIYSTMEFTNFGCKINSYTADDNVQVDSFEITKTKHEYPQPAPLWLYLIKMFMRIDLSILFESMSA